MRPAIATSIARARISRSILPKQQRLAFTHPRITTPISFHAVIRTHMSEPDAKRIKMANSPVIGTHNGHFHADEALAVYLLRLLPEYTNSSLIRTRDADVLKTCRTLVWNGPLGAFETPPFDAATVALAKTAAALTKEGSLVSVAGGGDTVSALNHAGVAQDFTFVSTAGGAFLEWMEGRTLPGVAALEQQR